MNILYFSPIPFQPVRHGNISTVNQYVTRLRNLGHNVHFVMLQDMIIEIKDYLNMLKSVNTIDIVPHEFKKIEKNKQGYYPFDSMYFDGLGETIKYFCDKYEINVIICTYITYSKVLEFIPPNIKKIIDTHDKMSDRHLYLAKNKIKDKFFTCTQEDEAKYLARADVIWARRDEETEFFNRITNSNKAITVTHFENPKFLNKTYNKCRKIGILASENQINAKMVCEFVQKLNKSMSKNKIDIELLVVGNVKNIILPKKKKPFRNLANLYFKVIGRNDKVKYEYLKYFDNDYVNVVGPVDKIKDFYNDIDIVIVPILCGTGINVKMVEAMAFGVPVISTECGIKGMQSNSEYHHCQTIEEVIDKIYEVYNEPQLLNDLATISKVCYREFINESIKNFDNNFKNISEFKNFDLNHNGGQS